MNIGQSQVSIANTICRGSDIGPCIGDVNDDGVVNVTDLPGVISTWGACTTGWPWFDAPLGGAYGGNPCVVTVINPCVTPLNPCAGDIMPKARSDGQVNVTDLLQVVADWGCTFASLSPSDDAPKTVTECEQKCANARSGHGQDYADCLEGCIETLERQGLLD